MGLGQAAVHTCLVCIPGVAAMLGSALFGDGRIYSAKILLRLF